MIDVCAGNTMTGVNSEPFQGSIFPVPRGAGGKELSTAGWPFLSPSETTVCVYARYNVCQRIHMHACVWFPRPYVHI